MVCQQASGPAFLFTHACILGGRGGVLVNKLLYIGYRLHPEVRPLTLLYYAIFDRKGL